MNPYEILGIAKDADAATIKTAYRQQASAAHPDRAGGSADRMAAVNQAYAILSDAERRAAFDEHGVTAEIPTEEVKTRDVLLLFVSKTIQMLHVEECPDLMALVRDQIADELQTKADEISGAIHEKEKLQKLKKRIRRRAEGPNLIEATIQQRLDQVLALLEGLTKARDRLHGALKMALEYEDLGAIVQSQAALDYRAVPIRGGWSTSTWGA